MNSCDSALGVIGCNDDNINCYGATSRTGWIPLAGGKTYTILLG